MTGAFCRECGCDMPSVKIDGDICERCRLTDAGDYGDDGVQCWYCHGEGGFHDCGEDCCCCADPEEITDVCPECDGEGWL